MSKSFLRGSEWRKWDLHVHAPSKYTCSKNDQYIGCNLKDKQDNFINDLKKINDISVIGITDYFSLDGYKFVIQNKDKLQNFDLILPNIEFRITPETSDRKKINLHIIFNTLILSVERIENFLYRFQYSKGPRNFTCSKEDLISLGKTKNSKFSNELSFKEGLNMFSITYQNFFQVLKNEDEEFQNNILVGVSNNSGDGASGIKDLQNIRDIIYEGVDFIFSAQESDRKYFLGQSVDSAQKIIKNYNTLKPCLHGSDFHGSKSGQKVCVPNLNRFCWIKSDPTFEGLKQVIYEPEDRVFIGDKPKILDSVNFNKNKYIKSLNINKIDGKKVKNNGLWFNGVKIEFNSELVAIIGNKGSGKSAIADILGLGGNSKRQENFSFIDKKRFKQKGFGDCFEATLKWQDGNKNCFCLIDDIDENEIETIRYLPQQYFERITNYSEEKDFEETLNNIIFSHISEPEKLGTSSFNELIQLKQNSIRQDIEKLYIDLKNFSKEIIKLEEYSHSSFQEKIKNQLKEKRKELENHKKEKKNIIKRQKPEELEKTEEHKKNIKKIKRYEKDIDTINTEILENREKIKINYISISELKELLTDLARFKKEIDVYKINNKDIYDKYNLDIEDAIKINIKKGDINKQIKEIENNTKKLEDSLITFEQIEKKSFEDGEKKLLKEGSLIIKLEQIKKNKEEIEKKLSQPEIDYQNYQKELKEWEEKKEEILGKKDKPKTINYYENWLDYLENNLNTDLKQKRKDRLDISLKIFQKKKEILEFYQELKKSVDDYIKNEEGLSDKFYMNIDANFKKENDFEKEFLSYINQGKLGNFYGKQKGENLLIELFEGKDLTNESDIKDILNNIITSLEKYDKNPLKEMEKLNISDQITKGKIEDFYDYVFSLKYLTPIYELKLNNANLNELSPGEKGTLLLVFYLLVDKENIPLVIDQPEDNLDNKSVFEILTHYLKYAKKNRQIIIVTHNPNLAVGADAEQIIYVNLDKKNNYEFTFKSGSIENLEINKKIVEILEGTKPAFDKRKLKYSISD